MSTKATGRDILVLVPCIVTTVNSHVEATASTIGSAQSQGAAYTSVRLIRENLR